MWFLPALFSCSIIFCIIMYMCKSLEKNTRDILVLGLVLLTLIIGYKTSMPRSLSTSLVTLIIFFSGFKYREYKEKIKSRPKWIVTSLIILLIMNNLGSISMVSKKYPSIGFYLLASYFGIYFVINISKYMQYKYDNLTFLNHIGKNTLYIMILHFFAFKMVSLIIALIYKLPLYYIAKFPVIENKPLWSIIYSIIRIIIPVIYVYLKSILNEYRYREIKSYYKNRAGKALNDN